MKLLIGRYPKGENERKVNIRIDNYDLWNLDHTLALVIHPALVKFRENLVATPATEGADGPEGVVDETGDFSEKRWEHIIDEMIFAFESLAKADWEEQYYDYGDVSETIDLINTFSAVKYDKEGWKKHNERIDNGLRLFGKYYRALWN